MFITRPNQRDPFVDLIRQLKPQAMLWAGTDASGSWGLSFPKRNDLLFCWMEQGSCQLLRPHADAITLKQNDFALIQTTSSFTLASYSLVTPMSSEDAVRVAGGKSKRLRVGKGKHSPVTLHGGKFVFDSANQQILMDLLPTLVHVSTEDKSSWKLRSLLDLNRSEFLEPGPGSEFIAIRLAELILVEILRKEALQTSGNQKGLLAGLADPLTERALSAMHGDIAHDWTVSELAEHCRVSRSTFANRFRKVVGVGPIEYLLHWRLAVAKDELRRGLLSITEIAFAVGFQSVSAFSTAFTREIGCSPRVFAGRSIT